MNVRELHDLWQKYSQLTPEQKATVVGLSSSCGCVHSAEDGEPCQHDLTLANENGLLEKYQGLNELADQLMGELPAEGPKEPLILNMGHALDVAILAHYQRYPNAKVYSATIDDWTDEGFNVELSVEHFSQRLAYCVNQNGTVTAK